MDIATLAATAVAALTPYVKDAVEDFAGKAGELALEKAKALFQRLKDKFSGDGYIEGALSRFEKAPEEYASAVEKIIQEAAEKDAQFADYVGTLVEEIEAIGPTLKVVQKMKQARNAVGVEAGEIASGTVDVEQTMDDAQGVTGVKAGRVGGSTPSKKE